MTESTTATTTATTTAPAFWLGDRFYAPRRGFEAALLLALGDEILTADELLARLTDSGLYRDVAPMALAKRPLKPINFLLKTWAAAGILRRSA